jgi:uncharacterized protein YbbK (DUF523 family)
MILVSDCLLGINCKYNGENNRHDKTLNLGSKIVPICPEQLGGLSTPRPPAEIVGGDGSDVLEGNARVVTDKGSDVTGHFIAGAEMALKIAQLTGAKKAVLKANSPSCGVNCIYDGTFSHSKRCGNGVTAALLKAHGMELITEIDL